MSATLQYLGPTKSEMIAMALDFAGFPRTGGLPDAREKGRYGYAKWKVEETREAKAPIRSVRLYHSSGKE